MVSGKRFYQWCATLQALSRPESLPSNWICQWRSKLRVLHRQCATCQAWLDTTVERPDPKDLSTLVSAQHRVPITQGFKLMPSWSPGALAEWLAKRMLVWVSQQASLHPSSASEFASGVPNWECYRQTVCYMSGMTWRIFPLSSVPLVHATQRLKTFLPYLQAL